MHVQGLLQPCHLLQGLVLTLVFELVNLFFSVEKNWLIYFPQIFILGVFSIRRNDYLECHCFKTLLELLIFLLIQIGMSMSGRVHTC